MPVGRYIHHGRRKGATAESIWYSHADNRWYYQRECWREHGFSIDLSKPRAVCERLRHIFNSAVADENHRLRCPERVV